MASNTLTATILKGYEMNFRTGFCTWYFDKCVYVNGAEIFAEPHAITLSPERYVEFNEQQVKAPADNLDAIVSLVNAHLNNMGFPSVALADLETMRAYDTPRTNFVAQPNKETFNNVNPA